MEELLNLLKEELFITWEDERTDSRLLRIIENAIPSMNFKLGYEADYTTEKIEQNLFLQYCVYVYNGLSNEFDANYYHEINQLRMLHDSLEYEGESSNASNSNKYITEEELSSKGYITEEHLSEYATKSYLDEIIGDIESLLGGI